MSGFVCGFFFPSCPKVDFWSVQSPTVSNKLARQDSTWVCRKLSYFLRALRVALRSQAPHCSEASACPVLPTLSPPQRTAASKNQRNSVVPVLAAS